MMAKAEPGRGIQERRGDRQDHDQPHEGVRGAQGGIEALSSRRKRNKAATGKSLQRSGGCCDLGGPPAPLRMEVFMFNLDTLLSTLGGHAHGEGDLLPRPGKHRRDDLRGDPGLERRDGPGRPDPDDLRHGPRHGHAAARRRLRGFDLRRRDPGDPDQHPRRAAQRRDGPRRVSHVAAGEIGHGPGRGRHGLDTRGLFGMVVAFFFIPILAERGHGLLLCRIPHDDPVRALDDRHALRRDHPQGADRRGGRPAAGHRGVRSHDHGAPLHLRHRIPLGRDPGGPGPVRPAGRSAR